MNHGLLCRSQRTMYGLQHFVEMANWSGPASKNSPSSVLEGWEQQGIGRKVILFPEKDSLMRNQN